MALVIKVHYISEWETNKLQLLLIMDQVNAKLVSLVMMHQDVASQQLLEDPRIQA